MFQLVLKDLLHNDRKSSNIRVLAVGLFHFFEVLI